MLGLGPGICISHLSACSFLRQFNGVLAKALNYRIRMYSTSHFMTAVRLVIRRNNKIIIQRVRANMNWALDTAAAASTGGPQQPGASGGLTSTS